MKSNKTDIGTEAGGRPRGPRGKPLCDEIQPMIMDFVNKELGHALSELVREHLRNCTACQSIAAGIQETVDTLKKAGGTEEPEHLSPERRKRITDAARHPLAAWIEAHHVLVSIAGTIVGLLLIAGIMRCMRPVQPQPEGITVTIGAPAPAPDEE